MYIQSYNVVTPLGFSLEENMKNLLNEKSGIKIYKNYSIFGDIPLSKIDENELNSEFKKINVKNFSKLEKMLVLSVLPLLPQMEITEKTLFILSSTKGNIDKLTKKNISEDVFLQTSAKKLAHFLGIKTTPIILSNACVSGAMALSIADRLLQTQMYENAIILAGDIISDFVLSGFQSFQAISSKPCKPYDKNRDGITLGEAATAMYVVNNQSDIIAKLLASSSINDANHISGPSRTGEGLYRSIKNVINESQVSVNEIDMINAHGTATLYNDEMESIAFNRLGMQNISLNSLKGYFGHTLGASGLLETVVSMEMARQGKILKSIGFEELGVTNPISIQRKTEDKKIKKILKTASGFGGTNTALLIQMND
ncbi:MAG: beta-ketoacyl synthase N-terminal-like domain-containing protein [Capnocytophaga sp.]|nr:beta-ketoacyl synthase N-terminal-like domain-containing protein [Capnocytophaga sp.]